MARWSDERLERLTQAGRIAIGAGIRRARLQLGISQRQLAWRTGLSQSTISRLEAGKLQALGFRKLALIAGVLNLGPDFFMQGGPPPPTRRLPGQPRLAA